MYDVVLAAGQTLTFTLGITADASDVVTVQSSAASVSFNVFGTEIS